MVGEAISSRSSSGKKFTVFKSQEFYELPVNAGENNLDENTEGASECKKPTSKLFAPIWGQFSVPFLHTYPHLPYYLIVLNLLLALISLLAWYSLGVAETENFSESPSTTIEYLKKPDTLIIKAALNPDGNSKIEQELSKIIMETIQASQVEDTSLTKQDAKPTSPNPPAAATP